MMDFLQRLFGRMESSSRDTAKSRLRLVLMQDRATLSPGLMESLKEDLIAVITKYIEVDESNMRVEFNDSDGSVAIVASIPVKEVKRTSATARRAGASS
ncbi:MAG: Cell division topological specificity factor [Firmicutes bacterium ADurb.Bin506]|jgi:cell division topological specificity factor|nr:MAG: Cell division topological specificity factor [Firmicutes bacterium ADurb.Bin506]